MKKLILLLFLTFFTYAVDAQIQNGYVKTIGRRNAPGKALRNVVISVAGNNNQSISDAKGHFDFKPKGKTYTFKEVRLNGYNLLDEGIIGRPLQYSDLAPVQIVMVSPLELREEKDRLQEKMMKNLNTKYARLYKETQNLILGNKNLKDANAVLINALDSLEKRKKAEEGDIGAWVEKLSLVDYDQVDSLNREILSRIEDGDFSAAQKLIDSKGSDMDRKARIMQERQAKKIISEDEARKTRDYADDMWRRYTMWKNDTNAYRLRYYLEERANIDTTNIQWQLDVAKVMWMDFVHPVNSMFENTYESKTVYNNHIPTYCNRAFRLIREHNLEKQYLLSYFVCMNCYYAEKRQWQQRTRLYNDMLEICEQLNMNNAEFIETYAQFCKDEKEALKLLLSIPSSARSASICGDIANLYSSFGKYKESNKFYFEAMNLAAKTQTDIKREDFYWEIAYNLNLWNKKKEAILNLKRYYNFINSENKKDPYDYMYCANIADSISNWSYQLGMIDSAVVWKTKAVGQLQEMRKIENIAFCFSHELASCILDLACLQCRNHTEPFEHYFLAALKTMYESGFTYLNFLQEFYCKYALCYALLGNFNKAHGMLNMVRNSDYKDMKRYTDEIEKLERNKK